MLVYPAHHVLNTDSQSRLFSYGAASRCDLFGDRSWISERLIVFSGGRKELYFILMQDQVSAGAFPPPEPPEVSLSDKPRPEPPWNNNGQKLLDHVRRKSYQRSGLDVWSRLCSPYSRGGAGVWAAPGWRSRCEVTADGQKLRKLSRNASCAHNYQPVRGAVTSNPRVPSDYLTLWFAALWISSQAENVKGGERGRIIDSGLKRRIQVDKVCLIGGVPLRSDPSAFVPQQIHSDKHE